MRRTLGLLLLVLLGASLPAAAQQGNAFTLRSVPGPAWADDAGARNPTLTVDAGSTVTVTVVNDDGGYHNLQVGDQEPSDYVSQKGQQLAYAFTAPASGSVEYLCPVHPTTMKGTILVSGTPPGQNGTPAPALAALVLALAAAALLLRRT